MHDDGRSSSGKTAQDQHCDKRLGSKIVIGVRRCVAVHRRKQPISLEVELDVGLCCWLSFELFFSFIVR